MTRARPWLRDPNDPAFEERPDPSFFSLDSAKRYFLDDPRGLEEFIEETGLTFNSLEDLEEAYLDSIKEAVFKRAYENDRLYGDD